MAQDLTGNGTHPRASWRRALPDAAVISLLVLGLFFYWFAVADRYAVFLYGHLGAQPFDEVTSSRYWMAGLVAAGIVMLVYTAANWLRGWMARRKGKLFCPPDWRQVWALSASPIAIGILIITMTMNSPTLPPGLALACVASTLLGLALALLPGTWAAERPGDLLWLIADATGLMPPLLLLHAVEFSSSTVRANRAYIQTVVVVVILLGAVWLVVMSVLRRWRRREAPSASVLFMAGLAMSYLAMPVAHYVFFAPAAYRYITVAENFFAKNPALQALALLVAAGLAVAVTSLRRRLR